MCVALPGKAFWEVGWCEVNGLFALGGYSPTENLCQWK